MDLRPRGEPMNQVIGEAAKSVNSQSTTAFGVKAPPLSTTPSRRRIALVPGSTTQVTDELHCLLRRRLRVAGLIALAGFATFLLKSFLTPSTPLGPQPVDLAANTLVVAFITVLVALLWSRISFGMTGLRAIELGLF